MKRLIHLADAKAHPDIWTQPFREALRTFGDLTLIEDAAQLSDEERAALIREHEIVLTSWGASTLPVSLAVDRGKLEYICHLTGTMRDCIPLELIDAGISVTNWGDVPAKAIAEGALTLLLATLKDLHRRIVLVRNGGWSPPRRGVSDTLEGLAVGVYGLGAIGRAFVDLVRPFGAIVCIYDPYATDIPAGCLAMQSLEELFASSFAIVIHAGLTDETRGSVTAGLLAKLPNGGIVINTARGAIIDQDALFRELESGRLRAGLDVLEPDWLPPQHPARTWENVIFSTHSIALEFAAPGAHQRLTPIHRCCLENLRRYCAGQPLHYQVSRERYLRST
jgi:phosphoglycerate dehydrogenase-like enzyme